VEFERDLLGKLYFIHGQDLVEKVELEALDVGLIMDVCVRGAGGRGKVRKWNNE